MRKAAFGHTPYGTTEQCLFTFFWIPSLQPDLAQLSATTLLRFARRFWLITIHIRPWLRWQPRMLRQHFPTLRLTRIRLTSCRLCGFASIGFGSRCTLHRFTIIRFTRRCSSNRFPHPLLMLPTLILAPMRLIHQLFLARLIMWDQLVVAVANQFLPSHCGDGFAQ